jgi:hypothetical protein
MQLPQTVGSSKPDKLLHHHLAGNAVGFIRANCTPVYFRTRQPTTAYVECRIRDQGI